MTRGMQGCPGRHGLGRASRLTPDLSLFGGLWAAGPPCLNSSGCPWLVVCPALRPHPGSLGCKIQSVAARDPQNEKVPGEHAGPLLQVALVPSWDCSGDSSPGAGGMCGTDRCLSGFHPQGAILKPVPGFWIYELFCCFYLCSEAGSGDG